MSAPARAHVRLRCDQQSFRRKRNDGVSSELSLDCSTDRRRFGSGFCAAQKIIPLSRYRPIDRRHLSLEPADIEPEHGAGSFLNSFIRANLRCAKSPYFCGFLLITPFC
jgi:hypothetical protein